MDEEMRKLLSPYMQKNKDMQFNCMLRDVNKLNSLMSEFGEVKSSDVEEFNKLIALLAKDLISIHTLGNSLIISDSSTSQEDLIKNAKPIDKNLLN